MKIFKDYKGFIDDIIKLVLDLDIEDDFIVEFSCLEPILKDNRPTYTRLEYTEVCSINSDADIIWFNDWYEGYQKSFDIISIISIEDAVKLNSELYKYKKLIDDMSCLSREAYETIALLEDKFRVR